MKMAGRRRVRDKDAIVTLYLNGTQVATVAMNSTVDEVANTWAMGGRMDSPGSETLFGSVHEVRIYDRLHAAADVTAISNALKTKWAIA